MGLFLALAALRTGRRSSRA
ncbi:MAG: hypothetical protein ACLFUT_13405 [Desulfobacteraceae bacterium]